MSDFSSQVAHAPTPPPVDTLKQLTETGVCQSVCVCVYVHACIYVSTSRVWVAHESYSDKFLNLMLW